MKVQVPVIVKDPEVSDYKGIHPTETVEIDEDRYLDGPVSPRVAVLDFDPISGHLEPGVHFIAPADAKKLGSYQIQVPLTSAGGPISREAAAVSLFGTIHKTLQLFKEADALGRDITWAFDSPQLLAVPRAGDWPKAFYERESRSVQFFSFDSGGRTVFTGHSQDIVAHETAHAIVDGVAPDLYNAITPQALAIHESIADLTAVLCAMRSEELVRGVLDARESIEDSNVFSGIGEQFAVALDSERHYLRQLNNEKSLLPDASEAHRVDRADPHSLSEVLSGALYRVLIDIFNELRDEYHATNVASEEIVVRDEAVFSVKQARQYAPDKTMHTTAPIKALYVAAQRFKRTLYRGLDYLPPGDATFADLGRTILAADQASHPDSGRQRVRLVDEFVKRGIVLSRDDLAVETNFDHPSMRGLDLEDLIESDYVAYEFANKNRRLLNIPDDVTFEVRPRLDVKRLYWHRDGSRLMREILFKVAWTETETANVVDLPRNRRYSRGTTLAIKAPESGSRRQAEIRTVVSTRPTAEARRDRTAFLSRLVDTGTLRIGETALGPTGKLLRSAIRGDLRDGALRVKGTSRFLHVTGDTL